MDAGNRRGPSTGNRMINSNPEPYRQPAAAPAHNPAPQQPPVRQPVLAQPTHKAKESRKGVKLPLIIIAIIAALGIAGWFGWSSLNGAGLAVDGGKYQAVFFTNGQVYFGKLEAQSADYLRLTDVFYLQNNGEGDSSNPQQAGTSQNNVQLIKLGQEIHGPEDEMIISRDQVLFYENLKADGKVSQSIEQYKKSN